MTLEAALLHAARVAVVLAVALASMPLLRRASASLRRLVLVLALGCALVLPAITWLMPHWSVPAPAVVTTLRSAVVVEPLVDSPALPHDTGATHAPAGDAAARVELFHVLSGVWALGVLLVLSRLVVGHWRSNALVRRSAEAPAWDAAVQRAQTRVRVRLTHELEAPAATGVVTPVVLVPASSALWSEARRDAVLAHELAHVRQHDCMMHILAQLVCALHWFNPLAWAVLRRLHVERELAADDAVLATGTRASRYAAELLEIAGAIVHRAPSGALGMADRSQLAARVEAIVASDRRRAPVSREATALLVAGAALSAAALACSAPTAAPSVATSATPPAPPPLELDTSSAIDPRLQAIVDDELDRTMREWQGAAGVALVLDPARGEILANAGRVGATHADVAVANAYVTGSTLKAVTLAAALDAGAIAVTDRIDCEQGKRRYGNDVVEDYQAFGVLGVGEMLAVSSNIGFSKVFDRLGAKPLEQALRAFHFGEAPPVSGAVAGTLPGALADHSFEGVLTAIGERLTATPLQLAAAYGALANEGLYVSPSRTRRAGGPPRERIVKAETARAVVGMLEESVYGARATGAQARVEGARVAGKTGTAEWKLANGEKRIYASFVGLVPSTAPRWVIVVGVEQPRGNETGGKVAAPAFARIATRALQGAKQ